MNQQNSQALDVLEARIDAAWEATPLPGSALDRCAYHILTFVEDLQRITFLRGDVSALNHVTNELKFALRRGLLLASRKCGPAVGPPFQVDPSDYRVAQELVRAGADYDVIAVAFSMLKDGGASCEVNGERIDFRPNALDAPHSVLDFLTLRSEELTPLEHLRKWMSRPQGRPGAFSVIVRNVQYDDRGRLRYSFVSRLADQVAKRISPGQPLLPAAWTMGGLRTETLRSLAHAIRVRCLYHLISIYGGSSRFAVDGGAWSDLLLLEDLTTLRRDIAQVSQCSESDVEVLLGLLAYGRDSDFPDPALQPIVPLSGGIVAIPCHTLLTCRVERNLLTLQARIRKREFDSQSKLFEKSMIDALERLLRRTSFAWDTHVNSEAGEIDLLLGQSGSDTLIVVELKWSIPTAEYREVSRRLATMVAAASQVTKKSQTVRRNLIHYSSRLGLASPATRVIDCLVCEGFVAPPASDNTPCIPFAIFRHVLRTSGQLHQLASLVASRPWVPIKDVHFETAPTTHSIGGITCSWEVYRIKDEVATLEREWLD